MLIDDLDRDGDLSALGTRWHALSDRVMGGISEVRLDGEVHAGRRCLRLRGAVRVERNGGFVQMGLDLAPGGGCIDARAFAGVEIDVHGNGERYGLHLRTADLTRPWQSYRAGFEAPARWRTVRLPFAGFQRHRTDAALDLSRLRRLAVVAIGRAFEADLRVSGLRFYAVGKVS